MFGSFAYRDSDARIKQRISALNTTSSLKSTEKPLHQTWWAESMPVAAGRLVTHTS